MALAVMACAACDGSGTAEEPAAVEQSSPAASAAPAGKSSAPSARALVKALAERGHQLPNARVNTGFCKDAGCVELVSTDAVSVYQFGTVAQAQRYAKVMAGAGPVEQAGVYVLSWAGRRGDELPSKAVRVRMIRDFRALVKG